ncbi:DUF5980 family protein [Sphaerisporangium rhizosphaerae]|uniref:DUF5980 family protein n=1 Tax=Sphaerisporangium rhizosphaerae TaxID=2269375 RepID=A0ABW2NTP0_9ACTN
MRTTLRALRPALGVTIGLALTVSGALPASATTAATDAATKTAASSSSVATTATWELRDIGQSICVTSQYGHPGTYFLVPVYGTWSTTLTTGLRNLPPGSTSVGGTPILPGSEYDSTIRGFVQLTVAPTPVGTYTAEVWASDGTVTQAVPAIINVRESC